MNKRQLKKKRKKYRMYVIPLSECKISNKIIDDFTKWLNGYKRRIVGI
jgi:hypothetical protein